ncbi:MAG: hypothetical protein ABI895_33525 [Deltaproteobacteria bacterium]
MSFRFVNFMLGSGQGQRVSRACCSGHGLCVLTLALGCGSNVVDAGALPEPVGGTGVAGSAGAGGAGVPDAGNQVGSSGCALPDLGRYRLVFDSDGGRLERRIYSMRADGTELEALTPPGELAREPALSPDGTRLAYSTLEGVRLLSLATGESELIMPDVDQPLWSPDGLALFYRSCSTDYCYVTGIALADRSYVSGYGAIPLSGAEFSADGSAIVYDYYSNLNSSLAEVSFGIRATTLAVAASPTRPPGVPNPGVALRVWDPVQPSRLKASHPTISPDSVWLAAALQCPNELWPSLWVSPLVVSTPACEGRRVTPVGAESISNPKWGPGVLIAYERGTPPRDIAIVAADTGDECVIQAPGDDRNPSWVPIPDFQSPQ